MKGKTKVKEPEFGLLKSKQSMRTFRVNERTKRDFDDYGKVYGSAGRALQVGVELLDYLARTGKKMGLPPRVPPGDTLFGCRVTKHTSDLIDGELKALYKSVGGVLWACSLILDAMIFGKNFDLISDINPFADKYPLPTPTGPGITVGGWANELHLSEGADAAAEALEPPDDLPQQQSTHSGRRKQHSKLKR